MEMVVSFLGSQGDFVSDIYVMFQWLFKALEIQIHGLMITLNREKKR
jgi:hypothetical protein